MGYCLEVDNTGETTNSPPEGKRSAELDCDNGQDTAGNSSISTKVYLVAGTFELRYYFGQRVYDTYYGTSYICGTTASDVSWANDTSYTNGTNSFGSRTNQVNVYLDQNTTTDLPPTHTTIDGIQQLAGTNLIDVCVYSYGWVQRSVMINVSTAGYYWLSLAADGANDSFGGDIDYIQLCKTACSGTAGDDFPPSWLPASNGGNNAVLFEDTFASPSYSGTYYNTNGNIGLSNGTSSFWGESGKGWGNAPVNQLPYETSNCPLGGSQCVVLGWGTSTNRNINNLISKPFLLDPGYYKIGYNYISEVIFATASGAYCATTPSGAGLPTSNTSAGTDRVSGASLGNLVHDTSAVGVFMSHSQLASTPNPSTTFQSTTYYTNPDGSTSTTPTVSPAGISITNYDASQVNPLLDLCGYATVAQARTRYVLIQKPAFYWLTFGALGTADGYGGQIGDVTITALGSPRMSGAPSNPVSIPVPNPQPGSSLSFTGFTIIVDQY
jgi:hypothetical protein